MSYKDFLLPEPMGEKDKVRKEEILHSRVKQVDFDKIGNVADLVEFFKTSSIQARNIGLCADVFEKMLKFFPYHHFSRINAQTIP